MSLSSREKKSMRQIAHHLDAVVTVAAQPISDGVAQETERALHDHELIKVKFAIEDREARWAAAQSLAGSCNAEVVHKIGKVAVLYRANPKANSKLSNISRYS
jgi:RNA-binding protein